MHFPVLNTSPDPVSLRPGEVLAMMSPVSASKSNNSSETEVFEELEECDLEGPEDFSLKMYKRLDVRPHYSPEQLQAEEDRQTKLYYSKDKGLVTGSTVIDGPAESDKAARARLSDLPPDQGFMDQNVPYPGYTQPLDWKRIDQLQAMEQKAEEAKIDIDSISEAEAKKEIEAVCKLTDQPFFKAHPLYIDCVLSLLYARKKVFNLGGEVPGWAWSLQMGLLRPRPYRGGQGQGLPLQALTGRPRRQGGIQEDLGNVARIWGD